MGKKKDTRVPHKHLHSRIAFLYQAANYLSQVPKEDEGYPEKAANEEQALTKATEEQPPIEVFPQGTSTVVGPVASSVSKIPNQPHGLEQNGSTTELGQSRRLMSHLRAVSLKSQIRLSPSIKHSFCRHCEGPLIPGSTSSSKIENTSRGGRKPWADILVVTCKLCGTSKRAPVGAKRQPRKKDRLQQPNGKP